MALIKCPECKKKISDTVDKCLQCGFDLKEVSKDELKIKNFQLDKKMIIRIIVVVVLLLLVFLGYKLIFPSNGMMNKAVRFLESEDYECEKISSLSIFDGDGEYICSKEDRYDNKREFRLTWDGGILEAASDIVHQNDLFDEYIGIDFWFYNDEGDYVYIYPEDVNEDRAYVIQDSKTSDHLCLYLNESNSDDLEVDYDYCEGHYDEYLDDLNDSLDEIRGLLDELDMD